MTHEARARVAEEALSPVDVAVIGAGMAGMSTAVFARRSGLSVRVFERHEIPGGACTSWKRNGYVFDYCVEHLIGTRKEQGFYDIWQELGVIEKTRFVHLDSFGRYVATDGQVFDLYTDYHRLQEHMLDIAPEDERKIVEFCGAIRKLRSMHMIELSLSLKGLSRFVRSLPALPTARKWSAISLEEWCATLKNPLLREAIPTLVGWHDFPMSGPFMVFALMSTDHVAYPIGGSLPIALAVEERARSLGAELFYRNGVTRIIVENGRAVGVVLDDGRVQKARHVVAACDARTVFDRLLEGRVKDSQYETMFKSGVVSPSLIQVSLGVEVDPAWGLSDCPTKLSLPVKKPFVVDGLERTRLRVQNYIHDPTMAPEGGTVLVVKFVGDYDQWKALREDGKQYQTEKKRILEDTIDALETSFPGIGSRIRATDVATPTSLERYTGSFRGSAQGWVITLDWMKKIIAGKTLPKTFPDLAGFYLIGQWSEPGGGLPPTARNGRDIVRMIMKSEGRKAAC
jgi:phytoene dehydrogenase-like protein